MNSADFQLRGGADPRLAAHAAGPLPAWLWSTDGTRILWANPVGARVFGAANGAVLAGKIFGPADPHRRQVGPLHGGRSARQVFRPGGPPSPPGRPTRGPAAGDRRDPAGAAARLRRIA